MIHVEALDHIVLNVADVDRTLHFYHDVLGLAVERLEAYRAGEAPFPSVRVNAGTIIDLFPPQLSGTSPSTTTTTTTNVDHLCLVVTDPIEALQRHIADNGIPIERGPTNVFGARGIGTSVYIRDPDDTLVELRTYR
ncbi:MAG TPA: VOC family protein [Candidatus Acidoferrum sp.]|nr:VOC family protein [Candidatus Acidoferrum sp.]